jgi:hypothetical protein
MSFESRHCANQRRLKRYVSPMSPLLLSNLGFIPDGGARLVLTFGPEECLQSSQMQLGSAVTVRTIYCETTLQA